MLGTNLSFNQSGGDGGGGDGGGGDGDGGYDNGGGDGGGGGAVGDDDASACDATWTETVVKRGTYMFTCTIFI